MISWANNMPILFSASKKGLKQKRQQKQARSAQASHTSSYSLPFRPSPTPVIAMRVDRSDGEKSSLHERIFTRQTMGSEFDGWEGSRRALTCWLLAGLRLPVSHLLGVGTLTLMECCFVMQLIALLWSCSLHFVALFMILLGVLTQCTFEISLSTFWVLSQCTFMSPPDAISKHS
jgi:hypothetical protein